MSRCHVLDLSIIIPTYDEEDNVEPLYQALMATVPALGRSFEIIFVDDGSRDQTFERLAALAARDRRVRVIKLRRNYGQAPAMAAGIDHARGRVLVTMDADLQNDPADIGGLLAKLEEGYDLVVGWRHERQDKWLSRKLPSVIANRLIALMTGVDVKDNGCTLKAFRADLIKRDTFVWRAASFHSRDDLDRRLSSGRDQGAPPSPPFRLLQIRLVADLQGLARHRHDQDADHLRAAAAVLFLQHRRGGASGQRAVHGVSRSFSWAIRSWYS